MNFSTIYFPRITNVIIITIVILIFSLDNNAAVRRVGYWGVPVAGIDYATFALAQTASSNGDTIYLFRGNYGNVNITKQLNIIGTGYLLDSLLTGNSKGNSFKQTFKTTSNVNLILDAGSSNSKIYGIEGNVQIGINATSNLSNIEVHRCNIVSSLS